MTAAENNDSLEQLKNTLVVSCQAREGSPIRDTDTLVRIACAAAQGGAAAIRANGEEDIQAIHASLDIPLIGLWKDNSRRRLQSIYITPTVHHATTVAAAGADIVAIDGTSRPRDTGEELDRIIQAIHNMSATAMADVATVDDGIRAEQAGADAVSTTLSGYTAETADQTTTPDFDLIAGLNASVSIPTFAEGRLHSPGDVRLAMSYGAHAVVVGTAITNPTWLTQTFMQSVTEYAT